MPALIMPFTRAARHWIQGLTAAALLGAGLGAVVLAIDTLRGDDPPEVPALTPSSPAVHTIGEDVATSFGLVAVEHAVAIDAVDDQQGTPGIAHLVDGGTLNIRVRVMITNLTDNELVYRPTQFELIDKAGDAIAIERLSQPAGELQSLAAAEVVLDFISTGQAGPFTVRFTDPATKDKILIDLGAVGCTAQGAEVLHCP